MGAMRGKAPDVGDCRGEAGEVDPESEEELSETEPERRREPMGMGRERGRLLLSLLDMVWRKQEYIAMGRSESD